MESIFIVQTPSPRSDLAWMSKFHPTHICCLGLWTPAELICAYVTTFLHEYNYDSDFLVSAPFQRRRHDEHALIEFCEKYGYSAQDAYVNASSSDRFRLTVVN